MPTVLIVDDEPNMRLLLQETLEELEGRGVDLLTAGNGEEALEIIKVKNPEIVILDVMMPVMSGFEVCNIAKNILGMKDIYVLMLSARAQEADRKKGQSVGADIYMTKPFNPDEILKRVVAVLGIEM